MQVHERRELWYNTRCEELIFWYNRCTEAAPIEQAGLGRTREILQRDGGRVDVHRPTILPRQLLAP
jgi:hypothetical protein